MKKIINLCVVAALILQSPAYARQCQKDALRPASLGENTGVTKNWLREPYVLGKGSSALTFRGRTCAQPMERGRAINGVMGEQAIEPYVALATLKKYDYIEIEAAGIGPDRSRWAQIRAGQEYGAHLREAVRRIKEADPEVIVGLQPNHPGAIADKRFSQLWRTYEPQPGDQGFGDTYKLLTDADVNEIINDWVECAVDAHEAGIDVFDVKCCHGYLLGQFLRPANVDRPGWSYGGNFDNRTKIVREIIERIRARIPDQKFKIMVRISMVEGEEIRGGIGSEGANSRTIDTSYAEMRDFVTLCASAGASIINVSAGIPVSNAGRLVRPADWPAGVGHDGENLCEYHFMAFAKRVRDELTRQGRTDVAVMGSGLSVFGDQADFIANKALELGIFDLAGWGRQTLAEPETCVHCRGIPGCANLMSIRNAPVGCAMFDAEATLLNTVEKRAQAAALRCTFPAFLESIDQETAGIPGLTADTEDGRRERTFIARYIVLGYLEAVKQTVSETVALIPYSWRTFNFESSQFLALEQRLRALRDASSLLAGREDFKGLDVFASMVSAEINELLVRIEACRAAPRGDLKFAIAFQRFQDSLIGLQTPVDAVSTWIKLPQLDPAILFGAVADLMRTRFGAAAAQGI